ncbi:MULTISPECIES: hypothetical protein [Sphingomonas]|nr:MULTISPECIES: hypothetical protein [Sphingomonas]
MSDLTSRGGNAVMEEGLSGSRLWKNLVAYRGFLAVIRIWWRGEAA